MFTVLFAPVAFAQPANDNLGGSINISGIINGCSANAAYTTTAATADLFAGTCAPNGPNYNVWFRFTATTSYIKVQLRNGGAFGTMRYGWVTLWNNSLTQLSCSPYNSLASGTMETSYLGLTVGQTYYVSVDNFTGAGYQGTFSLCMSDIVDYNFRQGAQDITPLVNGCSTDAAYTTIDATADQAAGTCAPNGPNYNRWFSFTATSTGYIKIQMKNGGAFGTMRYGWVTLWDAAGTQLSCSPYNSLASGTMETSFLGLTPSSTYYISVDNFIGLGYRGTFSLCLSDVIDYNFVQGAMDVTPLLNGCSADALYTTIDATGDQAAGSCAPNGPNFNRWFSFTASSTGYIKVQLKNGGTFGTQRYGWVTLWDASLNQLACSPYNSLASGTMETSFLGLNPTSTYYISVDNFGGAGYRGTFSLCLSDVVDYNFRSGAQSLNSIMNSCSTNGEFTTVDATGDQSAGTCAPNGPNYNRWFTFTATTTTYIKVQMKNGGAFGTMRYGWVTLWDAGGTQLACSPYNSLASGTMETSFLGLTPGATYYISVDNFNGAGYRGTFSMCLSDVIDYNFKVGAADVNSLINGCSANGAYTTVDATGDETAGTCAPNGPNYNRWFTFTATSTTYMKVQLKNGGAFGTMRYGWVTLWDAGGTQLSCSAYNSLASGTMETSYLGLTPGATYYISVDNFVGAGYRGTFSLCMSDVVDYNFKQGALDVTTLINGCSANAAYTTVDASADQTAGTCAPNGPNYNRWFKFTATSTTYINLQLKNGGAFGTMRYGWVTLWTAAGTQLACSPYASLASGTMETSYLGLTPGTDYYISVDNFVGVGYTGTFTLCVSDVIDYNFYEGATTLSNLNNWCSANAAYTTVGATADKNKGTCWNNGPNYNRWFKFVAITPNATIQVQTGGANGNLQYPYIALWQSNGTTQIGCAQYTSAFSTVSISTAALVVGNTYYISVDNFAAVGYRGTFKLCINNIGTTYYSRADAAWNNNSTWSIVGYGGVAAASFPNAGDVALISGNAVTVTSAQQAAQVDITAGIANTSLTIDNASLTVNGLVSLTNTGASFTGALTLQNNASMTVNDVINVVRSGGNQTFGINVGNGCSLTVNTDMNWTSSAGTVANTLLTVNGTGTVTVNRDVNLNSTGGQLIRLQFNNTSMLTVLRDINYVATAAGQEAIEFNNTAVLRTGRNIVRGGTPYGALTFNGSSIIQFNGAVYPQTIAADAGSGGDAIFYRNIVFNNTAPFVPQLTLAGSATANGNVTMTAGRVSTTASNILNLMNSSVTTVGSTSCYVDGPMTYEVATNTANTIRNFPIGKGGDYRPASISVTHSDNASVIYTAEHFSSSAAALGYTLPPTVDRVSGVRYWRISRAAVANLTTARATLYYGIGTSDGVTNFANLTVVKNVGAGTTWFDVGGTATGNGSGSITSGPFTSFSDMTLGNLNGGTNPLPINLLNFDAESMNDGVHLLWSTASEIENDFFSIERSSDGETFQNLINIAGAGTKPTRSDYEWIDHAPARGTNYYRLRQTDFDGKSTVSKIVSVKADPSAVARATVYPNPAKGTDFAVELSGFEPLEQVQMTLLDIKGSAVWSGRLNVDAAGFIKIAPGPDVTLSPGLHILRIFSGQGTLTTKLLVN